MPMFSGNDIGPKPVSQDRQLALHRTSIDKLEQTKSLVVCNRQHRAERRFDAFGKQPALRLCRGRSLAKNPGEGVAQTAVYVKTPSMPPVIAALTLSHSPERQSD